MICSVWHLFLAIDLPKMRVCYINTQSLPGPLKEGISKSAKIVFSIGNQYQLMFNPLLKMKNVIITSHTAAQSSRMRPASRSRVGHEIVLALSGKWSMSVVNPSIMPKGPNGTLVTISDGTWP